MDKKHAYDGFSFQRLIAIIRKEFIQMKRDRVTFAMMVGIPMIQLVLFGFAINMDPKKLPTVVVNGDIGPISRSLVAAMQSSEYFEIVDSNVSESMADHLLRLGHVQFAIFIPPDFEKEVIRGLRTSILVEADATDPGATSRGLASLPILMDRAITDATHGLNLARAEDSSLVEMRVHSLYNPEAITAYNIVPGLMGVILTMTLVMITALAITRERERGTMENLLSTPARPSEVLIGKILPYVLVGFIQITLVLVAARIIFDVPFEGSPLLLYGCSFFFILANLGMGITFSTLARNQLQAVQMAFFFFLPSILLSGFMFPFRGMPIWAQYIGSILPLTHFLRVVRGIMLKGNEFIEILPEMLPILLFLSASLMVGVFRYRQTLD